MSNSFERRHDILIEAPPEAVYDYVCNPNSWPEWLAASHHIDSADRALDAGEAFASNGISAAARWCWTGR